MRPQRLSTAALIGPICFLTLLACKSDDKKPAPEPAATPVAAAPVHDAAPALTPDAAKVDYFRVEVMHTVPKPSDPVVVSFPAVKVVRATFDPANLEGASAELELDLGTLVTGSAKRDKHLKDPDFFDVEKYPLATISVVDVKKKDGSTYSAQAKVALHGETQTWPVTFSVVESVDTKITIEATHKFDRNDFKVGDADTESIAGPVEAKLRVTLTPTN